MISIVIPTYNRAKVLTTTLESIRAQKAADWECIVTDDHSTDNTREVIQQYIEQDKRFVYVANERKKGAQGARNTGIMAAKGEWICLFDSDDIMYSDYIETMQQAIAEKVEADVIACYANIRNITTGELNGRIDGIVDGYLHQRLLQKKSYVAYDICVIKKQKVMGIGLLDEQCPAMQEWDTHIRLSKVCRYAVVDKPLCEWMIGGADTITSNDRRNDFGMIYVYRKHAWAFRRYAYRRFLLELKNLWMKLDKPVTMFLWAPELMLYIPMYKWIRKG